MRMRAAAAWSKVLAPPEETTAAAMSWSGRTTSPLWYTRVSPPFTRAWMPLWLKGNMWTLSQPRP